jgi:hypothetical protein
MVSLSRGGEISELITQFGANFAFFAAAKPRVGIRFGRSRLEPAEFGDNGGEKNVQRVGQKSVAGIWSGQHPTFKARI